MFLGRFRSLSSLLPMSRIRCSADLRAWSYQLWPDFHQATLFNDLAIALFVLDVFLVILGWPPTSPDESFAETYEAQSGGRPRE